MENISIHSLRMEGDVLDYDYIITQSAFQSTPSVWRETPREKFIFNAEPFQSTPSVWRETWFRHPTHRTYFHFNPLPPYGGRPPDRNSFRIRRYFNPLPPYGGRLDAAANEKSAKCISIHSLRMEGDLFACCNSDFSSDFNPLPPYGGRPR